MKMDHGSWEVTIDSLLHQIATTSHAVTGFIRAVRSARNDLVHVTRELSDLRLELELLRDEHNVPPQIQSRGLAVLDSCGVVLRRIGSLLGASPSPSSRPETARPSRWSVKERFETSNLCNCLQTYREALTLLPDVAALRLSKTGAPSEVQSIDREEVEEKSSQILEAVADLREAIPQAEPAIADSRQALEQYLGDVANYTKAVCNYLVYSSSSERPATSNSKLSDPPAPAAKRSMASASSTQSRRSPQQDTRRTAAPSPGSSQTSPDPNAPLEAVGPWFPSTDITVPFYNNQEQVLQHRANSYHVPRSPAPHSPLPRPPPQSSPPLPPPKTALPMLPPSAPRSKAQRHVAELPGHDAPEVRHVATHYSPYHQMVHPDGHKETVEAYHGRHRSSPVHQPNKSPHAADHALEAAKRNRAASEQHVSHPHSVDAWGTSVYVPSTPPSGQSSQRTSFQPSSLDSAPSRDTYRSSVSTGPLSVVDSLSPNTSPRTQLQPTFENTPPARPPSPRPSTTTTRSSGSASKGASLMDKIPGVFRPKRKSFQSADAAQSTYRNSVSSGSSSTVDQTPVARSFLQSPLSGSAATSAATASEDHTAMIRRSERQIEIVPAECLSDGKGPGIHHIEISPTGSVIATQHANNTVKVWSITTGAVEGMIKYSSKTQPGPRSRMYFLRPHAIMSEASTLVAITTSFGNTIEFWNWTKKKKIQSIDHAARWACVPGDVFEANMRPLAVYRSDSDRIDLYTATRDAKKPFVESRRINLKDADLPFVPKFPDLAYSSTGPLLVGAAGPRPGAPPEAQQTVLLAWQIDEAQENPRPYRWVVPDHEELNGALPSCVATYGSVAVSIWFPANYKHIVNNRGESKKIPIATTVRHVLVWDLATNRTRTFPIPNALSCVSPDCRYLAYCSPEQKRFVVMDVSSGVEVWSGPDELDVRQSGGSAASSQQLLDDLSKVTEFRFTDDSGLLYVADQEGGIGIYEVRQTGANGRAGSVSTASGGGVAGRYEFTDMRQELSKTRSGDTRS